MFVMWPIFLDMDLLIFISCYKINLSFSYWLRTFNGRCELLNRSINLCKLSVETFYETELSNGTISFDFSFASVLVVL